jgi:hypothetical protein
MSLNEPHAQFFCQVLNFLDGTAPVILHIGAIRGESIHVQINVTESCPVEFADSFLISVAVEAKITGCGCYFHRRIRSLFTYLIGII